MKIDLRNINLEEFNVDPHIIAGEQCWLITPKRMGVKWTQENKIFRSSVWNSEGEPVSLSFPKFVNFGESPEVFPPPKNLNGTSIVTKLDGSTLILSKYKGVYIIRTRGTVDASKLEANGQEIEIFKQKILQPYLDKYPENTKLDTWKCSIIFEWTSPLNKIIIDYGSEPQWYLIGWICHDNYRLATQNGLFVIAALEGWKRPEIYTFTDLVSLVQNIEQWNDKEGVCLYYNEGQSITKIKSASYLIKHRFKENATLENTIDLFFEFGKPTYKDFETKLIEKFDWECYSMVQGFISRICEGHKEVLNIIVSMHDFVNTKVRKLPTRKDQATLILSSYGNTNRAGYLFNILDNKPLDDEAHKKLLYQTLKKISLHVCKKLL